MMNFLAAEGGLGSMWPLLILGGLLVVMMIATIIPQKKRQKKAKAMMSALKAGDKIKTIGGFVGVIFAIDEATNTLILNIGGNGNDVFVTIDRNAIYTTVGEKPAQAPQDAKADKASEVFEEAPTSADDLAADKKASENKAKKLEKKNTKSTDKKEVTAVVVNAGDSNVMPAEASEKAVEVKVEKVEKSDDTLKK